MDWLWAKRSRRRVRGLGHPRPGRGRLAPPIPESGQTPPTRTTPPPNNQTPPRACRWTKAANEVRRLA